jgi:hypothetical protein
MDWKNQYYENGYITKSNLHVRCNPHQNSMTFTADIENITLKVHLESQTMANSQGNTEQKEQHLRYHNTHLQTILLSHSNKNYMVLAHKQT